MAYGERSLEQNDDVASEVSSGRNVKNMFERNSTDVLIMVEFFEEKFIPCRELFLTKTAVS